MNKFVCVILCVFAMACDNVQGVYPGDARNDLVDGNCDASSFGYNFAIQGEHMTATPLGTSMPVFTADAVGATGNEVMFRVNETTSNGVIVYFGEVVYAPRLGQITLLRLVTNRQDKSVFEANIVCAE